MARTILISASVLFALCLALSASEFQPRFLGSPRKATNYTLGFRQRGDYLLTSEYNGTWYGGIVNATKVVRYPKWGVSPKNFTFVSLVVSQSSNKGDVFLTKGGIGQNFIELTIYAYQTTYLNHTLNVFGK